MAYISQTHFSWQALDESSDIFRFKKLIESLDDRKLIYTLEKERKHRRNDYPVAPVWNSLLAGLVFGHESTASLIRELRRNAELRQVCGFDPLLKEKAVPTKDAYCRFFKKLDRHFDLILLMFHDLVDKLKQHLPDLGRHLAADGKAIPSCRKSDLEAAVGRKESLGSDGVTKITYEWFGYKLHLLCDATYELPLAFEVTTAAEHESPHLMDLVDDLAKHHEDIVGNTKTLAADRGYDDGEDKRRLHEDYGIVPLIPSRELKKEYEPINPALHDTIYISPAGEVVCKVLPFEIENEKKYARMEFMGYEKDRETLKFRCPVAAYGIECKNREACRCSQKVREGAYGRVVRVPLEKDRRLFGPIYAHSYKFKDYYNGRTSVERLNYRLDHLYGFERHTVRGLARMQLRMGMALMAMLATALGWVQANRVKDLRRRLQAA